jgi:hypothetical protein
MDKDANPRIPEFQNLAVRLYIHLQLACEVTPLTPFYGYTIRFIILIPNPS